MSIGAGQIPNQPPIQINGIDPRIARLRMGLLSYSEAEMRAEREIDPRWAHFDYLAQSTDREIRSLKRCVEDGALWPEDAAGSLAHKERLYAYAEAARKECEFIGLSTLRSAVIMGDLATLRRLPSASPTALQVQAIVPPPVDPAPISEVGGKLIEIFIFVSHFEAWISAIRSTLERGEDTAGGDKVNDQVILWMLDTYPDGNPGIDRKVADVVRKYQKHIHARTGSDLLWHTAVQRVTRAWDALGHPRRRNAPDRQRAAR